MIIKQIAIICLLLTVSFARAQKLNQTDCRLLQSAISCKDFKRNFYKCDSGQLTIIDTTGAFVNCIFTDACNRTIKFSKKLIYDVNKHTGKENESDIVLYKVENSNNKYKVYFWQPYSNGTLILDIRKTKKGFKVIKFSEGAF